MTPLLRAMSAAGGLVFLAVVLGLVARRRWNLCRFFTAYVAFALVINSMIVWWPEHFYRRWFYDFMQTTLDVLKFGITLEVGFLTFRAFPGARSTAFFAALLVLSATGTAFATAGGTNAREWEVVLGQLYPVVKAGTIWLMASVLALALWYRVPIHPFHSAILTSFVLYLGIASVLVWSIGMIGEDAYQWYADTINALDIAADLAMTSYWVFSAWRPESASLTAYRYTVRKLETRFSPCG